MKVYIKHIITTIIALLLTACASDFKDPTSEFKGQSADKIFKNAEKSLTKKHYEDAIKGFEALDIMYPFSKYAQQGQLNIIYAYYKNTAMDNAIAAANRYIHLYPVDPNIDYVYYIKAMANFDKTRSEFDILYKRDISSRDLFSMREAFIDFNELISRFPNSKYAQNTRNHMIYIRNLIAKHELSVAEYYMNRKAYVAAANRASYIVAHLNGTPQVKAALKIMIEAFTKLGASKEATEAQRVLDMNFPKT